VSNVTPFAVIEVAGAGMLVIGDVAVPVSVGVCSTPVEKTLLTQLTLVLLLAKMLGLGGVAGGANVAEPFNVVDTGTQPVKAMPG
jgi:hypothetical protein